MPPRLDDLDDLHAMPEFISKALAFLRQKAKSWRKAKHWTHKACLGLTAKWAPQIGRPPYDQRGGGSGVVGPCHVMRPESFGLRPEGTERRRPLDRQNRRRCRRQGVGLAGTEPGIASGREELPVVAVVSEGDAFRRGLGPIRPAPRGQRGPARHEEDLCGTGEW